VFNSAWSGGVSDIKVTDDSDAFIFGPPDRTPGGDYSFKAGEWGAGGSGGISQVVSVTPATTYMVSAKINWGNFGDPDAWHEFGVLDGDGDPDADAPIALFKKTHTDAPSDDWVDVALIFTPTQAQVEVFIKVGSTASQAFATWADNVVLSEPINPDSYDPGTGATQWLSVPAQKTVVISATDGVNTSTLEVTGDDWVDAPPVIQFCAGNQSVNLDGSCAATVPDMTGTLVASGDACDTGALIITQDPAAGTALGKDDVGDITVTFTVTDDPGGQTATCTATLTVGIGACPPCTDPVITDAVSRKTQGGVDYDIEVLSGTNTECRSNTAQPLLIVTTFDQDIALATGTTADVTASVGTVTGVTEPSPGQVHVTVTGLPNGGLVILTYSGVQDATGSCTSTDDLCVRVCFGDFDNNGTTQFFDFFGVDSGGLVGASASANPRADFDTNGTIQFFDFFSVDSVGAVGATAGSCPP
jgi:hypothetical protein